MLALDAFPIFSAHACQDSVSFPKQDALRLPCEALIDAGQGDRLCAAGAIVYVVETNAELKAAGDVDRLAAARAASALYGLLGGVRNDGGGLSGLGFLFLSHDENP